MRTNNPLPIPVDAIVAHRAHPGIRFIVDSHNRGEYGLTVARIGGAAIWANASDVKLVCRCSQVSDGAGGWRCASGRNCTDAEVAADPRA